MTDIYIRSAAQLMRDGYMEAGYSMLRMALAAAIHEEHEAVMEITYIMMDVRARMS